MPKYPGGTAAMMKYLADNVKYPKTEASGRVVVQFIVDKDGTVVEPKVVRSISPELDQAAINAIKGMPKWEAGKMHGKPVRVKYNIPVSFKNNSSTGLSIVGAKKNTSFVVFIDGKRAETIDNLNPNDIESITVLKDEAAIKEYDSDGKPVMLVTLKKK